MNKISQRATRFLTWHRRSLAVLTALACLLVVVNVFAPAPPSGRPVVVVVNAVAAGAKISAADVKTIEIPEAYLPDDAITDPSEVAGKVAVTPIRPGTTLTRGSILASQPPRSGFLHVPVAISDTHVVQLLRAGERVTVMGTDAAGKAITLASSVLVVALPETDTGGIIGKTQGAVVVLEVPAAQAAEVSQASSQRGFTLVMG